MKRSHLLVAALACLAVLMAGVVPWTIPSNALTGDIADSIEAATGLALKIGGRATIVALPVPRLKLEGVTLDSASGDTVVRASQLRGELRLLPLIAGRLELAAAALIEPVIMLATDEAGRSPWDAALARFSRDIAEGGPARQRLHVPRLAIVGGTLVRADPRGGESGVVRNVDVAINWARPTADLAAAGDFTWRGQSVALNLTGFNPAKFSAGKGSDLNLKLSSPSAALTLAGALLSRGEPRFEGRLALVATSLRGLDGWLDAGLPLAEFVEDFAIESPVKLTDGDLSLPAANVGLGSERLQGALTVRREDGRLDLSGTFAAGSLGLTRFLAPLAPARDADRRWSGEAFRRGALNDADLDLRISAANARIGQVALQSLAASVIVKNGRLEIALAHASAYKGTAKGRFSLVPTGSGIEAKLQLAFDRVDFGQAFGAAANWHGLTGTGSGHISLDAAGGSFADVVRSLNGRGGLLVKEGDIAGIDLASAGRETQDKPLSAGLDRGGRTGFEHLGATFAIAGGVAELSEASLNAPNLHARLGGRILLAERAFDLYGAMRQVGAAEGATAELPFVLAGSWDNPSLSLAPGALIQRSGAAGPSTPRGLVDLP